MVHSPTRFRKSFFAALLLVVAGAALAAPLEVREGRIKLILHEDLGRFSVYYLTDLQKGTYVPLFVDKDPRTSSTTLVVDNRVSRLGETSEYQQDMKRTASGAQFVWSSRVLQVEQSFELVTSSGSQLADGVRIATVVKNLGEQSLQVSLRLLVDTSLGEEGSYHFLLDGQKQVTKETDLTGSSRPTSWTSPKHNDPAGLGLTCLTGGEGIDAPERLILANWQRLNDSSWSFQASASRGFSNLPYSINDSAVAMYYGPRRVDSGKSTSVTTILASSTAGAYRSGVQQTQTAEPQSTTQILSTIASTSGIADPLLAAQTDLRVLNELLRSISARIADPSGLSAQEIESLRAAVRDLTGRVRKYTGSQTSVTPGG